MLEQCQSIFKEKIMCLNKCFSFTEDFFTSETVKHDPWLFALVLELKISLLNFVSLLKLVIFISTFLAFKNIAFI